MFYIDHNAKTTSFIDPRLPIELPILQNEAGSLMPPPLLDPNDQGATLLPPPPPRHHGACLTPPPSTKGPVSPSRLAPPVDPINRRRSRSVGDEEHCFNNSRYNVNTTSFLKFLFPFPPKNRSFSVKQDD